MGKVLTESEIWDVGTTDRALTNYTLLSYYPYFRINNNNLTLVPYCTDALHANTYGNLDRSITNNGYGTLFEISDLSASSKQVLTTDRTYGSIYVNNSSAIVIVDWSCTHTNSVYYTSGYGMKNNIAWFAHVYFGCANIYSYSNDLLYASSVNAIRSALSSSTYSMCTYAHAGINSYSDPDLAVSYYLYDGFAGVGTNNNQTHVRTVIPNGPCGGAYIYGYLGTTASLPSGTKLRMRSYVNSSGTSSHTYDSTLTFAGMDEQGIYGISTRLCEFGSYAYDYIYKFSFIAPTLNTESNYGGILHIHGTV